MAKTRHAAPSGEACGAAGAACCAGGSCDGGLVCTDGTCASPPPDCGMEASPCCDAVDMEECDEGLVCDGSECVIPMGECGALGGSCCATDTPCGVRMECVNDTCVSASPVLAYNGRI